MSIIRTQTHPEHPSEKSSTLRSRTTTVTPLPTTALSSSTHPSPPMPPAPFISVFVFRERLRRHSALLKAGSHALTQPAPRPTYSPVLQLATQPSTASVIIWRLR